MFITAASVLVRNRLKYDTHYVTFTRKLLLTTISRCVCRQNVHLAQYVLDREPSASH
jgi:hypothetical protein